MAINFICSCGEKGSAKFFSFKKGTRCESCRRAKQAKSSTLSPDEVRALFEAAGCELLDNYLNSGTPVKYRCSCGTISRISFSNFRKGSRCFECGKKKHSGENHHRYIEDRDEARLRRTLTQKYRNALQRTLEAFSELKGENSQTLMGYSPSELKDHITSHPKFEHVRQSRWQIDHIYPIKAFLDHGIHDVSLVNCLENLQPEFPKVNYQKNDAYSKPEFRRWLNSKGWFVNSEGFYDFLPVVKAIGKEGCFLIPNHILELKGNQETIENFLVKHFFAFTRESVQCEGQWTHQGDIVTDISSKYCVAFSDESCLKSLITFLSDLCKCIGEKCIYMKYDNMSFLVYPKNQNNQK